MLSVVMHVALLGACAWYFRNPLTTNIIAAGDGQGGGENAIEVSTIDGRLLGFTPPRAVSSVGDEENTPNNVLVSTEAPPPDPNAVVLPSTKSTPTPKEKLTTDRPTANQTSQLVSRAFGHQRRCRSHIRLAVSVNERRSQRKFRRYSRAERSAGRFGIWATHSKYLEPQLQSAHAE